MVALHPEHRDAPRQATLGSSLSNRRRLRLTSLAGLRDIRPDKGNLKLEIVGEAQEQALQQSIFEKKYVLGEVLGVGAMSRVRVATTRCGNRKVAVKCTESTEEDVRQITCNEYQLMSSLRFPSIVQVEGLYQTQQCLLMCMELCENGSLDSFVKKKKNQLSESQAVHLFSQLMGGVNYLHLHRIVHRDLKPANLLLHNNATTLKITDFNSAKRIGGCAGGSLMLTDRGTHIFSAPELRFGRQWNERVDIWAIGLCLFYMLRAELPFNIEERGDAAVLRSGKLPMIPWWSFTDMVRNMMLQCLTVDPHDRPPAMELMLHPIFGKNWWLDTDRLPLLRDATSEEVKLAGFTRAGHGQLYLSSCGLLLMSVNKRVGTPDGTIFNEKPDLGCFDEQFRDLLQHHPWAKESVCQNGPPAALAGRCHEPESPSIEPWKESRSGVDALQRLANNRCMRIEEKQETFQSTSRSGSADGSRDPSTSPYSSSGEGCGMSRSPSPKYGEPRLSPRKSRKRKDVTKFFTTHGAVQVA